MHHFYILQFNFIKTVVKNPVFNSIFFSEDNLTIISLRKVVNEYDLSKTSGERDVNIVICRNLGTIYDGNCCY